MPSFPDFTNPANFPSFASCPLDTDPSSPQTQILMGTIGDNMTVSLHPTFICKDRTNTPFALTLKVPEAQKVQGVRGGGYDVKGLKKGWTVMIAGARRSGVSEGVDGKKKQGFVECWAGDEMVIPASVEQLLHMSAREMVAAKEGKRPEGKVACQACKKIDEIENLSRCKGCEAVWYCNKECQTKGWSDRGHKSECKALKVISKLGA